MEKERVSLLAQLFSALRDAVVELEKAERSGSMDELNRAKNEILSLQAKIERTL